MDSENTGDDARRAKGHLDGITLRRAVDRIQFAADKG
jgi:hypothetical protein